MQKRPRDNELSPGLSPLRDVLETLERLNPGLNHEIFELWRSWDEIVGKDLGQVARPSQFKKGLLVIKVEDPVWLQELSHRKEELLEELKKRVPSGALKEIRFTLGRY